jgi:hypothetical protein
MIHSIRCSKGRRHHRFARPAAWTLAAALVFVIAGCLKVPLGDPEKSAVDPKFLGTWMKRDVDSGQVGLMHVTQYDARTYFVISYTARPDPVGAWERGEETLFKAWLTDVNGQTFVTMQLLGQETEHPYVVARLQLSEDNLSARGLQPKFVEKNNVTTPAEFRTLVEKNMDNEEMYLGDPDQYFKAGGPDMPTVEEIMKLFRS